VREDNSSGEELWQWQQQRQAAAATEQMGAQGKSKEQC